MLRLRRRRSKTSCVPCFWLSGVSYAQCPRARRTLHATHPVRMRQRPTGPPAVPRQVLEWTRLLLDAQLPRLLLAQQPQPALLELDAALRASTDSCK
jgi:hypothetical protein